MRPVTSPYPISQTLVTVNVAPVLRALEEPRRISEIWARTKVPSRGVGEILDALLALGWAERYHEEWVTKHVPRYSITRPGRMVLTRAVALRPARPDVSIRLLMSVGDVLDLIHAARPAKFELTSEYANRKPALSRAHIYAVCEGLVDVGYLRREEVRGKTFYFLATP
jgi:hypothetical protein